MDALFETGGPGSTATTHDWLTPPHIIHALGPFDMDPCASQFQPWRTAANQYTIEDNGLARDWHGKVWCNPPYGPHAKKFLARCASHGNAIALIFARTETRTFRDCVWSHADALLFLFGRLQFHLPGGAKASSAGAPSVLVAYGRNNSDTLKCSGLDGAFVELRSKSQ